MTTYIVEGTFPTHGSPAMPSSYLPSLDLSGTINITAGQITSVDIVIPGFASHFSNILYNITDTNSWLSIETDLTVESYNFNHTDAELLVLQFYPSSLIGFEQGKIGGTVVRNIYDTHSTVYYGYDLSGTICPIEGCAPWPVSIKAVPSSVVGADLPGLLLAALIIFGGFYWKRRTIQ